VSASSTPPTAETSKRMKAVRQRGTRPELELRSALHARGLRYRVDAAPVPGFRRRADVILRRARIAVYVDGCFWHSCPEHATVPKSNREWWEAKLAANVDRDRKTDRDLADLGWEVVRVWEHEDMEAAAARIAALRSARIDGVQ
jgi:DNA mismatch endonuclease, patch repair protein